MALKFKGVPASAMLEVEAWIPDARVEAGKREELGDLTSTNGKRLLDIASTLTGAQVAALGEGLKGISGIPKGYARMLTANPWAPRAVARAGVTGKDALKWWRALSTDGAIAASPEDGALAVLPVATVATRCEAIAAARSKGKAESALAELSILDSANKSAISTGAQVEKLHEAIRHDLIRKVCAGMTAEQIQTVLEARPTLYVAQAA